MYTKTKLITGVYATLTLFALLQPHAHAQTLIEAVDKTIQNNPQILSEAHRRISVDHTIDQARAGYAPQVDLNLGIGRQNTNTPLNRPDRGSATLTRGEAGLTATQMLYDGFSTKSQVDRTTSAAQSAGFSVNDTTESISLQAIAAYLNVLRRNDLLQFTQNNLQAHETIFSHIKQRSDSGVGRRTDVDQVNARLALSQANLAAETGNLEDAKTNYQRVIGNFPQTPVNPGDGCCDMAPAVLEDALSIAYNHHPALRVALSDHETSLAEQQGAKAAFQPRLDLDLGISADNNLDGTEGHRNGLYAMLRMQYNLLNGGADRARVQQMAALSEQQKAQIEIVKRQTDLDVRLAWNALETVTNRLPMLEQRVQSAEKTQQAYASQFRIGQRTLLDLLDSENELLDASIQYKEAYYDRLYSCYRLAEAMGVLLETMALQHRDEAITVSDSNNSNGLDAQ